MHTHCRQRNSPVRSCILLLTGGNPEYAELLTPWTVCGFLLSGLGCLLLIRQTPKKSAGILPYLCATGFLALAVHCCFRTAGQFPLILTTISVLGFTAYPLLSSFDDLSDQRAVPLFTLGAGTCGVLTAFGTAAYQYYPGLSEYLIRDILNYPLMFGLALLFGVSLILLSEGLKGKKENEVIW